MALLPWPRRRLLAARLCRYPSWTTARSTRITTSAETPGSRLTTRDTVLRLTPASAATSRMVARGRRANF